jgi:hypothetical protein
MDDALATISRAPLSEFTRSVSGGPATTGSSTLTGSPPTRWTSVIVPVRARANGTSPVTVEILTPLDQPVTEPVVLTSRVNALTGLGQVLTGGLVIVLLTWWLAHFRSRRRDLAAAAATDATGDAITNAPTDAPAAAELPAPDG